MPKPILKRQRIGAALALVLLAWAVLPCAAAGNAPPSNAPPAQPAEQTQALRPLSEAVTPLPAAPPDAPAWTSFLSIELIFGVLLLLFGMGVILIQFLMFRRRPDASVEQIMKSVTLTLIIVGTLFVVVSSVQDIQISSAIGLFGTIAGYLIGKTESKTNARAEAEPSTGEKS